MMKKQIKKFLSIGLSVLIVSALQLSALAKEYTAQFVKNHDGDTITVTLNGKKETVRLIGVDTAEIKQGYWGTEAQKFTENFIKGKTIKLETDISERDMYGRLLAYVFVDGKFLNLALAQEGYATLLTYQPNVKYVDQFTKAQKEARDSKKGIWSSENGLKVLPSDFRHDKKKNNDKNVSPKKHKKDKKFNKDNDIKLVSPDNLDKSNNLDKNIKVKVNVKTGIYHYPNSKFYSCKDCTLELPENEAIAKGYKKSKK